MTEVLEKSLSIENIAPLRDRVLVKRAEQEETSRGGILIPPTGQDKPVIGFVLAVGTGRLLDSGETLPMALKVGDKILFGKYAGTEVKIDDIEYIVMREDDVIGIIK